MISLVFNFVLYLYNNIIIKFINLPILNFVKFIDSHFLEKLCDNVIHNLHRGNFGLESKI